MKKTNSYCCVNSAGSDAAAHPCGFCAPPPLLLNSLRSTATPDNLTGRSGAAAAAGLPQRGRFPSPGETRPSPGKPPTDSDLKKKKGRSSRFHQQRPRRSTFLLCFGFPIRTGDGHAERQAAKRARTSSEEAPRPFQTKSTNRCAPSPRR